MERMTLMGSNWPPAISLSGKTLNISDSKNLTLLAVKYLSIYFHFSYLTKKIHTQFCPWQSRNAQEFSPQKYQEHLYLSNH